MPNAVGTTGDLYAERDNPGSTLGAPPAPPSDIPPPTKVAVVAPVTTKARMADERPDGSVRDTSTEALRPGNDLNFRNITDEEQTKAAPEPPAETKAPEPPKEAPKETPPAPTPEKVYAGKFKSAEDLEKSYQELERKLTETSQAKSALEREKLAAPPPPPAPKTPEQLAMEQTEANRILGEFASNPKKFLDDRDRKVQETTMVALTAQQIANDWRKNNPDLAEHEIRVAFEATLLAQSDPELARNHEALLSKATDNFRQFTGKIRTEGAKEALTQETRTIPLLSNTGSTPATEQPAKAPLTPEAAYDAHMAFLKEQEKRSHRGLRR